MRYKKKYFDKWLVLPPRLIEIEKERGKQDIDSCNSFGENGLQYFICPDPRILKLYKISSGMWNLK